MPKIRQCFDCGAQYADLKPSKPYKCAECSTVNPPRKNSGASIRKAAQDNPRRECVCCGQPGTHTAIVGGDHFLVCGLCFDFSKHCDTREKFIRYRRSGGASSWLAAGKRALFDGSPVGTLEEVRERDVPRLADLRRRPGSYQGGAPFGYTATPEGLIKNDEQQFTLTLIQTYLKRRISLNRIANELVRQRQKNKRGEVSWSASMVKLLAERERWI